LTDKTPAALVEHALAGNRRAIGRILTWVENARPEGIEALRLLYPRTGHARIVGVTGAPGSGKSTLVNRLALEERKRGRSVGIVAVDPSSPISGGAVLGDRVRMEELFGDPEIFVRSMASRDALGGLAETTGQVISVLDAVGKDIVIVETVGVGQAEVDIVQEAHTTIVVVIPGMGDDIQAMKAGLMEIADLFVVNKADRPGADNVAAQIRQMLSLAPASAARRPLILKTEATTGKGVAELVTAIDEHWTYLNEERRLDRYQNERARRQVLALARDTLSARLERLSTDDPSVARLIEDVADKRVDPYSAAEQVLEKYFPVRSPDRNP
jgi:LAO/AO transport system kinase